MVHSNLVPPAGFGYRFREGAFWFHVGRIAHRSFAQTPFAIIVIIIVWAGIAPADVLYVSNDGSGGPGSGTIRRVAENGSVSTFATGFSTPRGLALDGNGNLFVSELATGIVKKVTPLGVVTTFASGLSSPTGLAFDTAGDLYVAERGTSLISKISSAGSVSLFASGLNFPQGIAFDDDGNLFVANDRGQNSGGTISKVTSSGSVSLFVDNNQGLDLPFGIAYSQGNLYVSNFNNGIVSKITSGASVTTFATGLTLPYGLAFDSAGLLYASNYGANGSDPGTTISKIPGNGIPSDYAIDMISPSFMVAQVIPEAKALVALPALLIAAILRSRVRLRGT